jgi:hypothetical protein
MWRAFLTKTGARRRLRSASSQLQVMSQTQKKTPERTSSRSHHLGDTKRCCRWQDQAEKRTQRLCKRCCRLFQDLESSETDFTIDPFHESEAALKESLDFGCTICSVLGYQSDFDNCDYISVRRAVGCTDLEFGTRRPTHGIGRDGTMTRMTKFVLCRVEDDETLFSQCERAWSDPDSGSEDSLEFAATLLSRCVETHIDCTDDLQPYFYPTRLLDIDQEAIRLIDTRQTRISGPYAALSHTWGNTHIKVLTSQTSSEFSNGISFRDIPLTFQNAIVVARKLKIR